MAEQYRYAVPGRKMVKAVVAVAGGLALLGAVGSIRSSIEYKKECHTLEVNSREIRKYEEAGFAFIRRSDIRRRASDCSATGKDFESIEMGRENEIVIGRCIAKELVRKDEHPR
jgi:hypothetical protein